MESQEKVKKSIYRELFSDDSVSRNHIYNGLSLDEEIIDDKITNESEDKITTESEDKITTDSEDYSKSDVNNNEIPNKESENESKIEKSDLPSKEYSKILPIRRLFLLMISTLGLYSFYWIYKTNCYLRDDLGKDVSPGFRTLAMFIPIANIIAFYKTIEDINVFIKEENIETYSPVLNTIIHVFFGLFISFWVYINVQESINEFWKIKEFNLPIRRKFSNSEIGVMILGVVLWIIYLAIIIFLILIMFVAML